VTDGAEAAPTPRAGPEVVLSPEGVVAEAVRRHRVARGLTNGELAARAGISKAMLSKIEHARTSCSLTTLARLAGALAVPVADLLDGAVERAAVHTPAGGGAREIGPAPRHGYEDRRLGAPCGGTARGLEAHVVTLLESADGLARRRHAGSELLYVLEGVMVYGYEDVRYTLRPGDALQLDGEGEHGPHELLEAPVRFLSVVAPAG